MFPSPTSMRVFFSAIVTRAEIIILFISGETEGLGMSTAYNE